MEGEGRKGVEVKEKSKGGKGRRGKKMRDIKTMEKKMKFLYN